MARKREGQECSGDVPRESAVRSAFAAVWFARFSLSRRSARLFRSAARCHRGRYYGSGGSRERFRASKPKANPRAFY